MEENELPDLSGWRYVEIWTIEEAAMLWAAIDPFDHIGVRLDALKADMPQHKFKKAWISQRAISEAVCSGTLPFIDAWEEHEDFQNGYWEKKIEFPDLPDPNKLIPHMTRIRQAAFMKWADSKKILSYRQEVQQVYKATQIKVIQHGGHDASVVATATATATAPAPEKLQLAAPGFLDPANPLSPSELRAANEAWYAVTQKGDPRELGTSVKTEIRKFLDSHAEYREFSEDAKKRICTVSNWDKKGGAPKTPG